jgi:hypothetical protein
MGRTSAVTVRGEGAAGRLAVRISGPYPSAPVIEPQHSLPRTVAAVSLLASWWACR